MIREILQYPDQRLHLVSKEVAEITTETKNLIEDMIETMVKANGIGLAAPQIGVQERVIVIARSIIEAIEEAEKNANEHVTLSEIAENLQQSTVSKECIDKEIEVDDDEDSLYDNNNEEDELYEEDIYEEDEELPLECLIIINPSITLLGETISYQEGCLSVPEYREYVERKSEVIVKAHNEKGEEYTLHATGLLAVCIQHELDHLEGKLFIDRLSFLKRSLYDKRIAKRVK